MGRTRSRPSAKLERGAEPNEYRRKLVSFCSSEVTDRSEDDIKNFLVSVEKSGTFQFLQKYSPIQKRQLAAVVRMKQLQMDETLFSQENSPDALYCIIDGQCQLFKMQGDVKKILAYAGPGDSVGDLSQLDERCRRSISAQCVSDVCYLMQFLKADLDSLVVQWRIDEEEQKTQFILKSVPILQCISQGILEHLSPYFDKFEVPKDTVIYHQQDEASAMYFIWEGQVELIKKIDIVKSSKSEPSAIAKIKRVEVTRSMSVAILNPGEYFGEIEVINNSLRYSAAISRTKCILLSLSKTSLADSMPSSFLDSLFRYSTMRLKWRNDRICLVMEALSNVGWVIEKDLKFYLDPDIKPLPRMKSVLLPPLPDRDRETWLGVHTDISQTDAREWSMYHYGPWAQSPDTRRHESKNDGTGIVVGSRGRPGQHGAPLEKSAQLLEKRKAEIVRASFFSLG